ncbi:hypothetical protein [Leucobacter ruminantium]|uniref:Uncharacterized protein n=1 Tax=Leucobacter ruminantium TaxID=1289170 RepID=A0A939RXD2_9MICO|nr:hypothetical protein [Leucobacter ruminantium]MBO1803766.1 hypothetical protein [Leucobacter ruminantium]
MRSGEGCSAARSARRARDRGAVDPSPALGRRSAVGAALLGVLVLAGCSAGGNAEVAAPEETGASAPLPEETAPGVPEECAEVYPWATGPASLDDLALVPDGWPEAPEGATICTTQSGGAVETASYVTESPSEEVFAHFEGALAQYAPVRISGEENGTGYASLDSSDGGAFGFQIREAEGGFVIAFVDNEAPLE